MKGSHVIIFKLYYISFSETNISDIDKIRYYASAFAEIVFSYLVSMFMSYTMFLSLIKLTEIITNWLMTSWYDFDSDAVQLKHTFIMHVHID